MYLTISTAGEHGTWPLCILKVQFGSWFVVSEELQAVILNVFENFCLSIEVVCVCVCELRCAK